MSFYFMQEGASEPFGRSLSYFRYGMKKALTLSRTRSVSDNGHKTRNYGEENKNAPELHCCIRGTLPSGVFVLPSRRLPFLPALAKGHREMLSPAPT